MVSEQYLQDLENRTLDEAAWSMRVISTGCFMGSIAASALSYEDDRLLFVSGACIAGGALFGFVAEKIKEMVP